MTQFDTPSRALMGEDALERIRAFVASDIGPSTPLRTMAVDYLKGGAGFGPLEDRLTLSAVCDALLEMDARLKVIERREDRS